jgi:predicted dinucleotide-binding enzyme
MRIAVLGTGVVGTTLAARLAEIGHTVAVGTRSPEATSAKEDFAAWQAANPGVVVATFADAARAADLVLNATSGQVALEALAQAGDLGGKVVLDLSNALDFSGGFPPRIATAQDDSIAEQIQRAHPSAHVVKSLNTLNVSVMAHPERLAEPGTVFVSGDSAEAKATVTGLLHELGHTDVLDLGDVTTARGVEWMMPAWVRMMGALGTPEFNWKIVR